MVMPATAATEKVATSYIARNGLLATSDHDPVRQAPSPRVAREEPSHLLAECTGRRLARLQDELEIPAARSFDDRRGA